MTKWDKRYLTSKKMRARYDNISPMSEHRCVNDHRLGFPKPIYINGRKYYDLAEIEAWERSRAEKQRVDA